MPDLPFETASWERRILALLVDYAACWGVMLLIYGGDWFGNGSLPSLYLNLLFIARVGTADGPLGRLVRSAGVAGSASCAWTGAGAPCRCWWPCSDSC